MVDGSLLGLDMIDARAAAAWIEGHRGRSTRASEADEE
jgi:hypothetical protein